MKRSATPVFEGLEARNLLSGSVAVPSVSPAWPVFQNSHDVPGSLAGAETLRLNPAGAANIFGSLYSVSDSDVYAFTPANDGILEVSPFRDSANVRLDILDSLGNDISNSLLPGANGTAFFKAQAAQRYYLAVTSNSGFGSYRLRVTPVTDDYADQADGGAAITLAADGSASFTGRLDCMGDVDFRKFTPAANGTVTLTRLSFAGGTLNVEVTNSLGEDVAATLTDQAVSFDATANQTYYVRLSSSTGLGLYSLDLVMPSAQPPITQPDPPAGPTGPTVPSGDTPTAQSVVTAKEELVNGLKQLWVLGTNQADSIVVTQSGSTFTVASAAGTQNFTDTISAIVMYGFGGGDTLNVTYSVSVPTTIYGGDGNNHIFDAAQAPATLYGGAGSNLFVSVGTPAVTIHGGSLDSFWVDAGDTIQGSTNTNAIHRISSFYQPFTTDSNSPSYISTKIQGQSIAEPAITGAASGYANFADKPLFGNGPSYSDIRQGGVGDCYFVASLASLAQNDAAIVQQMITPLGDGTYAVRFYSNGSPVYVRVDADLPVTSYGSLAYANFGAGDDIWVALVEKAYAYYRRGQNSYASIDSGWMVSAYSDLTGTSSISLSTAASFTGTVADWIRSQLSSGHAVTLGSDTGGGPIVSGHAYMAQSVTVQNGVEYVTVYNPWGVDGGGNDSNPYDGLVTLTVDQVVDYFANVVACQA